MCSTSVSDKYEVTNNSPSAEEEGMIPKDNPTIPSDACFLPEGYKLHARLPVWDCASTAHIVSSADLLDDYQVSVNPTTVSWGSADNPTPSPSPPILRDS